MLEFIELGGPLMYVLLICSVATVAVFVERLTYLIKTRKRIKKVSKELETITDYSNINEINEKLNKHKDNILTKLLRKIVDNVTLPIDSLKDVTSSEANKEVPKLSRFMTVLSVIYSIAPMLGLLGTVIGLTITLQDLVSDPDKLLNGIYMSLITTITGLIIAIPTHIAYSFLNSMINRIVLDLETKSSIFMERVKEGVQIR
jgi:biopolymer transport protein ExbB